ncbi:PREDICTED: odorant receptor 4-like [Dinoponera quadriceps]|uniref:Odorant receptor n=1 Tax=Dinoponera quadriceps TaxID=609295 RepID=A0A6P3XEH4_DINQU|nr:PREDICTED: odorant receptor 4-like [Dinoponera quadriceps]
MPRLRVVQSSAEPLIANMEISPDGQAISLNASYQRDVRYIFTPSNWILGSIGIWPVAFRGIGQHISKLTVLICNFVLSFAILPCALHIIYDQKDLNIRLKLSGLLGFCSTAMMKFFVLVIRRPKIRECIEHIKDDWWQVKFKPERELMLKYASAGRKLSIISASSMYTAGFIYHLVLPFCTVHKIANQTIRPLVYPTYSQFIQTQVSPLYEIVYLAHCMCGYTMYTITAGSCGLAAIFAAHACGQIGVIASKLEDLPHGKNYGQITDVNKRIAAIVKSHVRVLRFAALVDEILQEVCLLEFISSVFTMCLPEYFCIVDWQDSDAVGLTTYFLLFISFCFNMYILCYIGELLMEKSSQIGSICFTIDWYQLPVKSIRSLILVIAMSSHPIKISAGRMLDLSLATFGNVLKTSLAYLSFLRTIIM